MGRFDDCLHFICDAEGGYVNDPLDRGGATNCGITQRTYNEWLTHRQLPLESVKDMSDADMKDVYKDNYWVHDLPIGLDLLIFDSAVQHGRGRAIKWLQELVGVATDGVIGDDTRYHVNQYILREGKQQLIIMYLDRRQRFYDAIILADPTQSRFKHGWQNRMDKLKGVLDGL